MTANRGSDVKLNSLFRCLPRPTYKNPGYNCSKETLFPFLKGKHKRSFQRESQTRTFEFFVGMPVCKCKLPFCINKSKSEKFGSFCE